MLKLEENPPVLYPEDQMIETIRNPWWVAHTKARNEKALAWNLQRWEIPYFLPLREKLSIRKGRRYKSLLPIFSGYVFFAGTQEIRYRALTSNRIAQVLEVVNQQGLIHELEQIHRALRSGAPLDAHPYLKVGSRCRVKAGPLLGVEGILLQKKNLTRLLLKVEILGQAAAVDIDADLLEAID